MLSLAVLTSYHCSHHIMGADCEICGDIVRITKEGVDKLCADCDFQRDELVATPGVGEDFNPVIPPSHLTTNTAKSKIPTSNFDHS